MKKQTLYFSTLLESWHKALFFELTAVLKKHGYPVKTLSCTKDIWMRDFMPLKHKGKSYSYIYNPDYLQGEEAKAFITDTNLCIETLDLLQTKSINLVLDGGNLVTHEDTIIMTDKVYTENPSLKGDINRLESVFTMFDKVVVIPRDPDKEEIYGHSDGMVRFISKNHVLVNSYAEPFRTKLLKSLTSQKITFTELKIKEHTQNSWGYINFLHLDGLIIQPSIDKTNDGFVQVQLEKLYPSCVIEPVQAKPLTRKGGVFNCVSWER